MLNFMILEEFLKGRSKRELILLALLILSLSIYLNLFIIYPKIFQNYEFSLNKNENLNFKIQELQEKLETKEELDYTKTQEALKDLKEKIQEQNEQIQTYKNGYSSLNVLLFELSNKKLSQISIHKESEKIILEGILDFNTLFDLVLEIDRDLNFTQISSFSVYPNFNKLEFHLSLSDLKED
ncbi:hypothetical protein HEBU111660_05550 [Helicobacter burdigaliensis]